MKSYHEKDSDSDDQEQDNDQIDEIRFETAKELPDGEIEVHTNISILEKSNLLESLK